MTPQTGSLPTISPQFPKSGRFPPAGRAVSPDGSGGLPRRGRPFPPTSGLGSTNRGFHFPQQENGGPPIGDSPRVEERETVLKPHFSGIYAKIRNRIRLGHDGRLWGVSPSSPGLLNPSGKCPAFDERNESINHQRVPVLFDELGLAKHSESLVLFHYPTRYIIMTARALYIGVDFALWAKKLRQKGGESFNGLKRESAAD